MRVSSLYRSFKSLPYLAQVLIKPIQPFGVMQTGGLMNSTKQNNNIRLNLPALCGVKYIVDHIKSKCCLKDLLRVFCEYLTWPQSTCSQKKQLFALGNLYKYTQLKHYLRLKSFSIWLHVPCSSSSSASLICTL